MSSCLPIKDLLNIFNIGIQTQAQPQLAIPIPSQQRWPKSSCNCSISEKLRLMQPQSKIPWLGKVPSFVLSALRAVLVFVERKQTSLKEKRDKMRTGIRTSLITHTLNFHSSGAFQSPLRATNWPDLPVPQKKQETLCISFKKMLPFTCPLHCLHLFPLHQ